MTEHAHSNSKSFLIITVFYTQSNSRPVRAHLYFEVEASTGNSTRITNSSNIPLPLRHPTYDHSWQRRSTVSSSQHLDLCSYAPYLTDDMVTDLPAISKY